MRGSNGGVARLSEPMPSHARAARLVLPVLVLVLVLVACGGPSRRAEPEASAGSEREQSDADDAASTPPSEEVVRASAAEPTTSAVAEMAETGSSTGATVTAMLPNLTRPPPREPSPLTLIGYALAPDRATRVLMGRLELPPGERFVPPVSSCQDVLVYLAEGTLDASGTGIASVDAPATLYAGDAVRFGPEGDGLVVNATGDTVRTLVAIARQEDAGPARLAPEERSDRLACAPDRSTSGLVAPMRLAAVDTTQALSLAGIEARILLDADATGAEHAGLAVITAGADVPITEHTHDGAAEVLYVEDGDGTMRIGERTVEVHAGTTVYVPAGTPHAYVPSGRRPLRALQFYAPSGPEQRFRGAGG